MNCDKSHKLLFMYPLSILRQFAKKRPLLCYALKTTNSPKEKATKSSDFVALGLS